MQYDIFSILKRRKKVETLKIYIGKLNGHFRYRKACKLEDERTPRKYFLAKITFNNGLEALLLEIEREGLKLTTLALASNNKVNWGNVIHRVIVEVIKRSGVWPEIEDLGFNNIDSYRFKHTSVDIDKKVKRIFNKIYA